MSVKRIFAAVDIPDNTKECISRYIGALRRDFGHLRGGWESPEKMHITVKFAGDLDEGGLDKFMVMAANASAETRPFEVSIGGTGVFIRRRGPNVLWLGVAAPQFTALAAYFDPKIAEEKGRPKPPFNPHLTVARLREPDRSHDLVHRHMKNVFGPVEFTASGLSVYESTLLPTGSVYTVVSNHAFSRT